MSDIDKIRDEVQRVREEHPGMGVYANQWCAACSGDTPLNEWVVYPCPTLRFAERMLKLAEALADMIARYHNSWKHEGMIWNCSSEWCKDACSVLAECAKEKP
jgi:hypothetical protein